MAERALRDGRIAQAAREAAAADSVQQVQIAYPRTGDWSGKNQLGVEIPYDPNAVTPQTILKLDEWGFPEVWTVSLGVRFNDELVAGQAFDAVALVSIGSGGINQEFECDFVDGTMFSAPMNAINVRCVLNSLQAFSLIPAPNGVKVSVMLSRGDKARSRATFTRFLSVPAGSTSSAGFPNIRIPAFSKSVSILPLADGDIVNTYGPNFKMQFFANSLATAPVASVSGSFLGPGVKIPIPALARYFRAENTGAVDLFASATFSLFDE
jgi:hypothetical protein